MAVAGLSITDAWTDYGGESAARQIRVGGAPADVNRYAGKDHIKNAKYFPEFTKAVIGKKILRAERRGKNVLVHLESAARQIRVGGAPADVNYRPMTILIHMKMTGHVMYGKYRKTAAAKDPWKPADDSGPLADPYNRHIRLALALSDGKSLVLSDMRRFAKVSVAATADLPAHPDLAHLGPEPLAEDFTLARFRERLMKKPKWKIKQALLAQDLIAGIGNIYSDEILWHGGVHPFRPVAEITPAEWKKMFAGMKETLRKGIDFGGDSDSDYRNIRGEKGGFQKRHEAYRRTGQPCRKRGCGGTIRRLRLGGRSAHFCGVHQAR